jgi:hypothetical protein
MVDGLLGIIAENEWIGKSLRTVLTSFAQVSHSCPKGKEFIMSSSTRLKENRNTPRQQVLPAYEPLGRLSLVYLLGSLASGYTEEADLDIMMVWDDANVPAASLREPLVSHFDERPDILPFVVDYRDIHLERYVIAGQEYNVAHQT